MNIRYPIYEGVYRILTFHPKHPDVLPKNIRVYYPKTSGCFNGKDADVMTSQYTGQTGSVLMGEALSPYTSRVH